MIRVTWNLNHGHVVIFWWPFSTILKKFWIFGYFKATKLLRCYFGSATFSTEDIESHGRISQRYNGISYERVRFFGKPDCGAKATTWLTCLKLLEGQLGLKIITFGKFRYLQIDILKELKLFTYCLFEVRSKPPFL